MSLIYMGVSLFLECDFSFQRTYDTIWVFMCR